MVTFRTSISAGGPSSKQFDLVSDQVAAQQPLGLGKHRLQGLFEMRCVAREAYYSHHRPLPQLLMIQFGDGHVELPAQA